MKEVYKEFEKRRSEMMRSPEFKDKELGPEKEKEILKEVISETIKQAEELPLAEKTEITQKAAQLKDQPKERQMQFLVDLALDKGIVVAVNLARSLESAYLLDEFHDTLVDQLYRRLVEEGKLKQI